MGFDLLLSFLPCPPWEGPPFPSFLGIRWPGRGEGTPALTLPAAGKFIKGVMPSFGSSYTNEETWEWKDYKGRERKIVVSRHARES